MRRTWENKGLL